MKTLFDHLNDITYNKTPFDISDTKEYNQYMINRYISMDKRYVDIIVELSKYNLTDEQHYNYLCNKLPKVKTYFKYIKGVKEKDREELKILMKHYKIGLTEAKEYMDIMSSQDLKTLLNKYKYGKNGKSLL